MNRAIKNLVPGSWKNTAKAALGRNKIRRGVRAITSLGPGESPTREMLQMLSLGWGNDGFTANVDYLQEVAKNATTTEGPILECGSGLTTLLLGLLAGRRGVAIRSLEHSPQWQQRISRVLTENKISNVAVLSSPLRDYGDFSWYNPPLQELPDQFRLVICDGPPGDTKGGRYGLFPVFGGRLPKGTVIVLDDANRPAEIELVNRWKNEVDLGVEVFNEPAGSFATLVKRS